MLNVISASQYPALICLDLDGTLVDSAIDIAAAVDSVAADLGFAAVGETQVRLWVGGGALKLIERLCEYMYADQAGADNVNHAYALFLQYYERCCVQHKRIYPGVVEALEAWRSRGVSLACITNKPGKFTQKVLQATALDGYFSLVLSGDSLANKKPHPEPLLYACNNFSVNPGQALMIGDSRADIDAAHAAGLSSVCVSYGYRQGESLEALNPGSVVDSLAELINLDV